MSEMTWGVTFSTKYADEMGLDWQETFLALKDELGVKRFRLMSYWDDMEPEQGKYDFSKLDWQIEQCKKTNTHITLCLGLRQPRWPECHRPEWAKPYAGMELYAVLEPFIRAVVERYKDVEQIISWQLENEALNRGIGTCQDYSRERLRAEYKLVKSLDDRPVIMSTSNNFSVPFIGPIPNIVGFSLYRSQYDYKNNLYTYSKLPPLYYRLRAGLVRLIPGRPTIIHELQCEPWGPKATVELSDEEQAKSMNPERFEAVLTFSQETGLDYADLWGGEWWYWRKTVRKDDGVWKVAESIFQDQ